MANDLRLFERACQLCECGGLTRPDRFAPPRYEGELFAAPTTDCRSWRRPSNCSASEDARVGPAIQRH